MGASMQGQRILVVEDEPFIALDMEAVLTSAGAHVIAIHHLQGAIEAARTDDITAAVLDVALGDGDCSALCEVRPSGMCLSSSTPAMWMAAQSICGGDRP
jgi:DNA-binding response OmpR family regulator